MNSSLQSTLLCPVCRTPLVPDEKMYGCANGHPFNIAREGYINLLLSHQCKSKNPGDDADMVMARRRFFDSGAFAPLSEALTRSSIFKPSSTVLDCGCGEGHLLGALSESRQGCFVGVDISKKAIQIAARRHKQATWIVANAMRELPVADSSIDAILSILAPRNPEEFLRVLKPNGVLLVGVPGPNHLIELREQLQFSSGDFRQKADEAAAKCAPQFAEINRETVRSVQPLGREQIADLIRMTPIFWRSSPEAKAAVMQLDQIAITISFALLTFSPNGKIRE